MSSHIDFYFDIISPYAYIAHKKIQKIKDIKFIYKPILLGGLHNLAEITAPAFNKYKMKNMQNDCELVSKKNQIDFKENNFTYSNPTANIQEVWALVENNDLDTVSCLGLKQVATLHVEPRPVANPVTIDRQCDGDSELDLDSQDGIYPFDVSLIENQVINDQTNVTVTYFNEDGTQIENFSPIFSTASQTITIRVERDPSYPDITNPDGLCYDETTLEFIVDDSPEAYPVILAPHCDGDDGEEAEAGEVRAVADARAGQPEQPEQPAVGPELGPDLRQGQGQGGRRRRLGQRQGGRL